MRDYVRLFAVTSHQLANFQSQNLFLIVKSLVFNFKEKLRGGNWKCLGNVVPAVQQNVESISKKLNEPLNRAENDIVVHDV